MKNFGVFSILKRINMRPFGSSGDDYRRREESYERGRMSSGPYYDGSRSYGGGGYGSGNYGYDGSRYGEGYQRSTSDHDRYGRRQSVPGRFDQDRFYSSEQYGRSQSLDNRDYNDRRYRSPSRGNRFDRYQSPDRFGDRKRSRWSGDQFYGERYGRDTYDGQWNRNRNDNFEYGGDRYGKFGSPSVNRYQQDQSFSRDYYGDRRDGNEFRRYGQGYGRYAAESNRFGSENERYGGNRYGYDSGRYGYGGNQYGFGNNKNGYESNRNVSDRFRQGFEDDRRVSQYGYNGVRRGYDNDRFGQGYDRMSSGTNRLRYGVGIGDRFQRNDRFDYDTDRNRYGSGRYGTERYPYSAQSRPDFLGRSYPRDRQENFQDRRTSPSRVRFDGDRSDYSSRRPVSGDRNPRDQFERRPSVTDSYRRRDFSGQNGRGDGYYRTEATSNVNRRFEPNSYNRQFSRQYPDGTSDTRYEMQGGSRFQGGCQYGTQFNMDRMPPPIPPFAEPRSNYPAMKALTWYEGGDRYNQNSGSRCRELAVRASYDLMRRRYYESAADPSQNPTWLQRGGFGNAYNPANISSEVLRVQFVDFYPRENSKESRTFEYEIVRDPEQPNPVLRRGQSFRMTLIFNDREFDASRDNIYVNFYFGPNPSVPKRTRIVLPITPATGKDFERAPHQWDARMQNQEGNKVNIEVFVPSNCPVGLWRSVVETSSRDAPNSRLQYRCPEDVYVIFNPFCRNDTVWMENDTQRFEYVLNESGKVYTGGYRNVRSRPWIYGQFDDCVLPAACLLLEMSGLPHSERGNPVKVARALASMIKASRPDGRFSAFWNNSSNSNFGLVEERYEDDFRGGNSPHLWTGSLQIIEEFLRGGASPVKYGQCWVIAGLMTSMCRALGLPARPVTAYVSAIETQDSLTVDRYVDRYGDVLENGPSQDQPDSVWSFHVWCDVWMQRPDQPQLYSGWQATDPCRSFRDFRDLFSGACGPCPIEALRRGDVGLRDDVDAFYASLNAYVRYFYEDDESGWGYSPFRQFRYPMSRFILTKAVGRYDEDGDSDCDDLTNVYRDNERSDAERFAVFNSCRGYNKDMPPFEYQAAAYNWGPFNPSESDQSNFDVSFELDAPERVMIGQAVTVPVVISNNSPEPRNIQTNICTRSSFYTGVCGPYLKRSSTQLTLAPNQQETITLTLDPWDYQDKLVDMAFVKITVTSFVQETGQSFIDEFDFRFNKPRLNIDVSELRVGQESEAQFSFVNPLDVPLTDCFLTLEVSGSVRPRTIQISREVGPRETFNFKQTFVPRFAGERRMVATFSSRQLQDIVGQRAVDIRDN